MSGLVSSGEVVRLDGRADDPKQAEDLISEAYLPVRLRPLEAGDFGMDIAAMSVDGLAAGRITFDRRVLVTGAPSENFQVAVPMRGHADFRRGTEPVVPTGVGRATVYDPGFATHIDWGAACEVVCLMVTREKIETEVESLLGRALREPLSFDFSMDLNSAVGRRWCGALKLVRDELDEPSLLGNHPIAALHAGAAILDGLILGQRHNASDDLLERAHRAHNRAVARVVDLLEASPGEPWTVTRLSREAHLSVRSLQEGFQRELGISPMTYLREVRLRRAQQRLREASPQQTTVRAVATGLGFLHLGRFSGLYKQRHDEYPSETLARPPS